jgi:hypothetical protein
MAEVAAVAPMPMSEKPADAPAAAPAKKKPPYSSNDKEEEGKEPAGPCSSHRGSHR